MTTPDPGQVTLAVALVVGLATACQVVAPKLKVPALVLLLPVGFALGILAPEEQIGVFLGPSFQVAVDLIVAVILFQGGLDLSGSPLGARDHRIARKLVWVGGTMTWLGATVAAHVIIGMDWPLAFMLGAIVIVSGPTVVTPILDFAGVRGRLRSLLQWEGTFLDPIGALVAVIVFQLVKASGAESIGEASLLFLGDLVVGIVAAAVGVVLFVVGGKLVGGSNPLGTQVLLGSVLVAAGLANVVSNDTGLLAALLMGMAAPRIARHFGASLDGSRPFFNTVVTFGIGVLFVAIAGLVTLASVTQVILPAAVMAIVLILVLRPLVVLVCTAGSDLQRKQRIFIAWMDPRGIVAAATASSVGASLVALRIPGAGELLPAAFVIVAITVAVYGLTAGLVARALGLDGADDTEPVTTP